MSVIGACSICTEPIIQNPSALPCGHTYHYECIWTWVTHSSMSCPKCRRPVVKEHIIKLFVDPVDEETNSEETSSSEVKNSAETPQATTNPSSISAASSSAASSLSSTIVRGASPFTIRPPPVFPLRPTHPQPPMAFVRITRPTVTLRPRPFVCLHAPPPQPRPTTVTLRPVASHGQSYVHHSPNCIAARAQVPAQVQAAVPAQPHGPNCPAARTVRQVNAPTTQRLVFTPMIRLVRHVHCPNSQNPSVRRVQVQGQPQVQFQMATGQSGGDSTSCQMPNSNSSSGSKS